MKILKFWLNGIIAIVAAYVGFNLAYWLGLSEYEVLIEIIKH